MLLHPCTRVGIFPFQFCEELFVVVFCGYFTVNHILYLAWLLDDVGDLIVESSFCFLSSFSDITLSRRILSTIFARSTGGSGRKLVSFRRIPPCNSTNSFQSLGGWFHTIVCLQCISQGKPGWAGHQVCPPQQLSLGPACLAAGMTDDTDRPQPFELLSFYTGLGPA